MSLQAVILNVAGKIKADVGTALTNIGTILTRLSAARAAKLDTMLSTAQWSNGRAAKLDNLDAPISGIGGGGIKSVQRGTVSLLPYSGGFYINIINIAAVNMAKTFVLGSGTNDQATATPSVRLINSTQIRIATDAYNADGSIRLFAWQVVEFN